MLVHTCAAQFMVVLDVSVVNVAPPSLQTDLGSTTVDLRWAVNAATAVPPRGRATGTPAPDAAA
ncbi:hypothetical protein [Actinomadura sp. NEAU-AAG7]|uniref:hypothetical protein n=1 Tax=Actinomadura sp. NEAU-AAG7 TaxID=2839640 RepID=UPI001BE44102|nr:hypothetical protein [Actinomadura sp. NEAU-AAG7]MBT2213796.1 hypothetical protein [Actinomadura sp. NEAU-AAG7]